MQTVSLEERNVFRIQECLVKNYAVRYAQHDFLITLNKLEQTLLLKTKL